MPDFMAIDTNGSLTVKLWRGERMCLIAMDVANPEPNFAGFSIEWKAPGATDFSPLYNRLAFSYPTDAATAVTGSRDFSSLDAPFQKFRWMHFPWNPVPGLYAYRVTMQSMDADNVLTAGDSVTLEICLDPHIYADVLDVGFTRGFASSQAYVSNFKNNPNVTPPPRQSGLSFKKLSDPPGIYEWMGFESYDLMFGILNEVVADETKSLDVFAYDFDEPDILALLLKLGPRLRIILDDSGTHAPPTSDPSLAAQQLIATAGAANVKRMHFQTLQHNKVFIVKTNGVPTKVLFGSCNFSFRGLYIQNNNTLVFYLNDVAQLFAHYFEAAFTLTGGFASNPLSQEWHPFQGTGVPNFQFAFSPHAKATLSLDPIADAINGAKSSVFFAIAFLYQSLGPVRSAIDTLMTKPIFSYGISDKDGKLNVKKPDGSLGIVDFAYLAQKAPPPFSAEWSGGAGINEHNKFVVVDFNLPTATVFTGSSNLSPGGETGNGDNLIMIQDQRVAVSFALEALRIFDHLQFRAKMQAATGKATKAETQTALTLQKPAALGGPATSWFAPFYVPGSQAENDRLLFSH
jgi:phosphatidylserine/phosphatidylglycerophosphate/cardiolipin synthase-like enzyme